MASRRIGTLLLNPANTGLSRFLTTLDIGIGSGLNADLLDGQHGSYYSPISSPALTGTPTAPTASTGTNTTQIATTAFVVNALSSLVDSAPATLNTLNELAAALGDDSNFSTTVTNSIATKLSLSGGTISGKLTFSQVGSNQFIQFPSSTTLSTVTANDKIIVFRNLNQLRFENGNNWNYNNWAGISFDSANNKMYIGGPAASQFTSNAGPANIDVDFVGLNASGLKKDGNVVWHAGNDGASSGLDADLLDGQQGSYYLDYNNLTNVPAGGSSNADTLDSLDSTQFLRSDAADTATGTVTFDSGANVVINSNIGANGTTAFASMTGRLQFDNDYSDTARGANKILLYYDGNAWMGGFGVHSSTVSYYTGADHVWYRSNSSTSFTERMRLSSAGILTVNGNVVWHAGNDGAGSGLAADSSASCTGNAATATKLQTARSITLTGDVTGTATFDGSANISITTTGGGGGGATNAVTTDYNSSLNSDSRNSRGVTRLYRRDNNSDYSVQTYWTGTYWRLYGYNGDNNHADTYCGVANQLATARTISLTGDVSGSVSFNGSANVSITTTVADNSHNHTNYIANTVNAWITSSDSRQRIYFANNSHSYWKSSLFHYWRVGNTDVNALTLDSSYNLTALGNITAYSDISLKENIESIENPLMIIRRMRGVRYDRNDIEGSKKHVGVIAQEVEEVLPEVVNIDETGLRTVAYGNITSVLIEGIKELEKIIIAQKDLILDMSNRISKLEEDNNGK